jgi:glycosyltransferase involved in cell wall biosynthesis
VDLGVVRIVGAEMADPDPGWASRAGHERRWRVVALLTPAPEVDIVIPVHNEERDLAQSVGRLRAYLKHEFPFSARITIADGASTDGTLKIAGQLAADFPDVRLLRINENGRGRALAAAWLTSDAGVVAQMEVDLTSGLSGLLPMVAFIVSGYSDVSIGGRSPAPSRNGTRDALGRFYNLLLRWTLGVRFQGARCQIKALRADVARRILPTVGNRDWFFDTELLVRVERAGLRIHELQPG